MATLGDLTRSAAETWGDRVAWVFDLPPATRTFAEVERQTNQIAHGLIAAGVHSGEGVAILLPNVVEWPLAWIGAAKAGAFVVPINVRYRSVDAGHLLTHSGAVGLITDEVRYPELRELIAAIEPDLPELRFVTSAADLGAGRPSRPPPVTVVDETLVNVQYTSGTTGMPKGCMLSHRYFDRIARVTTEHAFELDSDDVMLTAQPFSYLDPQWNIAAGLYAGARVVVLDGFHPSTFWAKCAEHDATFFYCLGAMPTLLLEAPVTAAERDHRVRFVSCSAIPPHRHAEMEERFEVAWHELYGSTECGADIVVTPAVHDDLVGSGALGRALPHREVMVVADDGRPVSRGTVGELLIRGLGMFDGYYRDPEATATALAGGWYHTGDLVTIDDDDLVRFVGRTKDMIRRGGENIAAAEVETVIQDHPAVKLAACVAVPDELRQEEVKAFVVPADGGAEIDVAELASYVASRLAHFKVPRYWEVRTGLPLTPSQRVAKHALVEKGPIAGWDRDAER